MVHSSGRRLDPTEPALPHHFIPRHRDLRVPAKEVGRQQLSGDSLLPGVDHLGMGGRFLNLLDVPRFNRIAKNNPHAIILNTKAVRSK
jgi:hypothetical protein